MIQCQQSPPIYPLNTAVLFLVFNRLDVTRQVFGAIRTAQPPRIYIAADGARANKVGETDKVQAVRDFIMQNLDWECEVKTLFRDQNLGCKYAVSGAISWFFENEEQGIILEDDCVPSQSFFWFCEELLNHYRNDESIFLISGDARGPESFGMKEDYGFCKYPLIWGWASWSRVWKNYDPELRDWPEQRDIFPSLISDYKPTIKFWRTNFDKLYMNEIDTWDYQLTYLLQKNDGKCIVPKQNLVSNVGFGVDATHTFNVASKSANRPRFEINLPLNHSPSIESEIKINDYFDRGEFSSKPYFFRIINKLSRLFNGKNVLK